jgi:hypothetical protein
MSTTSPSIHVYLLRDLKVYYYIILLFSDLNNCTIITLTHIEVNILSYYQGNILSNYYYFILSLLSIIKLTKKYSE